MIVTNELTKKFLNITALNNLNMTVNKGSIYGLIGTNGAGKTTALKVLAGVLRADSGTATIDDFPIYENPAAKCKLVFIPDDLQFYTKYSLKELAKLFSSIYQTWNPDIFHSIICEFHLDLSKKLARFSRGMQKQAVFAVALATMPEYLLLDEPIDGLDPLVRKTVWKYIVDGTATRQMTTLVSSHNLREMEGICDSIGIISKGHMLLEKDLEELREDIHKVQIVMKTSDEEKMMAYQKLNILHSEKRGAVDIFIVKANQTVLNAWETEFIPALFDPIPLSLEDIFIHELKGEDNAIKNIIN